MKATRAAAPDPLQALERDALRPYYLLHGEETFLVDRALAVLRRRLLPDGQPGTWQNVWAADGGDRLSAALAELTTPSLFGGTQVLIVRHAEALRDDDQERIVTLLPRLSGPGGLILVARALDQRRRLLTTCVKAGAAFAFAPLSDPRAAQPWIVRLARERGHDITPAAVQELLERSGLDLGVLAGEVDKLVLHAGAGARLEVEHVREMVGHVRTHVAYELTDRLARGDAAGVAVTLRRLLAGGEPPIRLLGFLASNLRRALHVAELAERGLGPEEIAARLGMPSWLVSRTRSRATAADLVRALGILHRVDQELKDSGPSEALFEAALMEIVRASGDRRRGGQVSSRAAG